MIKKKEMEFFFDHQLKSISTFFSSHFYTKLVIARGMNREGWGSRWDRSMSRGPCARSIDGSILIGGVMRVSWSIVCDAPRAHLRESSLVTHQ